MKTSEQYPNARTTTPSIGLLLCFDDDSDALPLRISHVFERRIYVVAYSTPAGVRTARKPHPLWRCEVTKDLKSGTCKLRKAPLPLELFRTHPGPDEDESRHGKETRNQVPTSKIIFGWIGPLIEQFDVESNLARFRFTALIKKRADELGMKPLTLRRLVYRFYYFGRAEIALTPLLTGPEAATAKAGNTSSDKDQPKYERQRRGRQPVISKSLGKNTFVVDEVLDVEDMVKAVKRCGRKKSDLVDAHDEYLKKEFAKRHPAFYQDWLQKRCPLPVTYRQFRLYTQAHEDYEQRVLDNIPALADNDPGRSSHASGPGEIYEIDATGGRIHLVATDESGELVLLGTPWIYLLIDRWSRFIVSVYVTLGSPSWEEVRYALLIAFTPRVARFRSIGIEVNESRWPQGRMCSALAQDRGAEFRSKNNLEATAKQLRIEPLTLPPLTPDGKAIEERYLRDLKKKMASNGLSGVYAERPIDPKSKRVAKKAQAVATTSLRDVYRAVVKAVDQKNNSPHASLKKNLVLAQAGVRPIPRDAYLWGCEHLTGARVSPLTEDDYRRMLLSIGRGSIANSRVTFEKRKYQPADANAHALARASTKQRHGVEVRFDKTFREEIHVVTQAGQWSLWQMTATDRLQIQGVTMGEENALEDQGALLWATAENDSRINRHSEKQQRVAPARQPARHADRPETLARRRSQTHSLKAALIGRAPSKTKSPPSRSKTVPPTWRQLEETERLASINRTRQRKSS